MRVWLPRCFSLRHMENLAAKKNRTDEAEKLRTAIGHMTELRAKHLAQGALETVRLWDAKIARFESQVACFARLK